MTFYVSKIVRKVRHEDEIYLKVGGYCNTKYIYINYLGDWYDYREITIIARERFLRKLRNIKKNFDVKDK